LVLPIALFGILWLAVFTQMATGNDPALSGTRKAASTEAPSRQKQRSAGRERRSASSTAAAQQPATVLAYDPLTGTIVRVPASGVATQTTTPTPAPVTTSQS
jgi:hypothetical protein